MDQLRESLEKMGLKSVRTYVQSGNVVFSAAKTSNDGLADQISRRISRDFGLEVSVVVKTPQELAKVLKLNPFLKKKGVDLSKLHVTFLQKVPSKAALEGLKKINPAVGEEFRLIGAEFYLHCPLGYGSSKLSNAVFEKALSIVATTRNWNTVNALVEMASSSD